MNGKTSDAVTIGAVALMPIEQAGQRVVTLDMIDQVHGRPKGTARKRFNDNRGRFIEGEDFFVRNADEAAALGIRAPNGLTLLSESGYLLLAKSLTDDVAWDVQRKLVAHYFRARAAASAAPLAAPTKAELGRMFAAITKDALDDFLAPVHASFAELVEKVDAIAAGRVADPAATPTKDYMTTLAYLEGKAWPSKGRRAVVNAVSARMMRHSERYGFPIRTTAERGIRLFHLDAWQSWEDASGRAYLSALRDQREGQGRLRLDRTKDGAR